MFFVILHRLLYREALVAEVIREGISWCIMNVFWIFGLHLGDWSPHGVVEHMATHWLLIIETWAQITLSCLSISSHWSNLAWTQLICCLWRRQVREIDRPFWNCITRRLFGRWWLSIVRMRKISCLTEVLYNCALSFWLCASFYNGLVTFIVLLASIVDNYRWPFLITRKFIIRISSYRFDIDLSTPFLLMGLN